MVVTDVRAYDATFGRKRKTEISLIAEEGNEPKAKKKSWSYFKSKFKVPIEESPMRKSHKTKFNVDMEEEIPEEKKFTKIRKNFRKIVVDYRWT